MPKLYSEKRHKAVLTETVKVYDGRLKEMQAALADVKEENRRLSAETAVLKTEREAVTEALVLAGRYEREEKKKAEEFSLMQRKIALQSAMRAQRLLDDVARFSGEDENGKIREFQSRLAAILEGNEPPVYEANGFSDDGTAEEPASEETDERAWSVESVLKLLGY